MFTAVEVFMACKCIGHELMVCKNDSEFKLNFDLRGYHYTKIMSKQVLTSLVTSYINFFIAHNCILPGWNGMLSIIW